MSAAAATPMRSPLRRRTSSNSKKALVACSASRTAMYGQYACRPNVFSSAA